MQEAEACTRPLQNHFPVFRHRTTLAGVLMPQYLREGNLLAFVCSESIQQEGLSKLAPSKVREKPEHFFTHLILT